MLKQFISDGFHGLEIFLTLFDLLLIVSVEFLSFFYVFAELLAFVLYFFMVEESLVMA